MAGEKPWCQWILKWFLKVCRKHNLSKVNSIIEYSNWSYLVVFLSFHILFWRAKVLPIMEAKGLTSPLLNCTSLTLETCLTNDVFPGVASMLGISPNLETLVITKFFPSGGTQVCFLELFHYCLILFHDICKGGLLFIFHFFNFFILSVNSGQ